ncbi:MAG: hypothetical protein F6K22_30690 [Okeania sp. SIO2F4]|uniref:hypothetical protein n=1 Tax=Okeania sp. SIO2F4 TaxID=2607790 RepID=UPI0014295C40|nr:hypothetical protein [Okeania sp. SIO2F4]NES06802.1 hypothetical protein [Okeania sp. SIO2F4]
MNIQTNLNKAFSFSLVALSATSLSFATITPVKVAFARPAQVKFQALVSPRLINKGMNGRWNLQWKVNGWLYKGRLKMDGNLGTMVVNVTGPNGRRVDAEQRMNMHPERNGYTLQGNRPTYPGRNAINLDYQADSFHVELDDSGNWSMKNCSDDSGCIPVKVTQINSGLTHRY